MEKYFVIKDVDGMCFTQKSFNDENKAKPNNNKPNNNTTMEKYFVIKDVDGMYCTQKSFNDENKANCFAELLADGNDKKHIKYYVAKVTVTK